MKGLMSTIRFLGSITNMPLSNDSITLSLNMGLISKSLNRSKAIPIYSILIQKSIRSRPWLDNSNP